MSAAANPPSTAAGAVRLLLGIVLGAVLGAMANMGVLAAASALIPPPTGVDANDPASINAQIGDYSVPQLLVPFFAHAIGTLVGAFVAAKLNGSVGRGLRAAMVLGLLYLTGGAYMVSIIPASPLWFDALDLGVAYLPMAYLGFKLATRPPSLVME